MALLNFDSTNIDTTSDFDVLPPGWYNVSIEDSDVLDTKAGNGSYIKLKMRVLDGDCANRVIFTNITVSNPNQDAVQIGQKSLAKVCKAVGLPNIQDTQQLHAKPFQARLIVKKDDQYGDSNEVRDYKPVAGAVPHAAPQQATPAQAAAGGSTPPWANG